MCREVRCVCLCFCSPPLYQLSYGRGHCVCAFKGIFFWESSTAELFCVGDEATFTNQLRSIFYQPLKSKSQPWSVLIQPMYLMVGGFEVVTFLPHMKKKEWFFCWTGAQKSQAIEVQFRSPSEIGNSEHTFTTSLFQIPKTRVKEKNLKKKKVLNQKDKRVGCWEIATHFWTSGSRWGTHSSCNRAEDVQTHMLVEGDGDKCWVSLLDKVLRIPAVERCHR